MNERDQVIFKSLLNFLSVSNFIDNIIIDIKVADQVTSTDKEFIKSKISVLRSLLDTVDDLI